MDIVCLCVPDGPLFQRLCKNAIRVLPVRKTLKYFDVGAAIKLSQIIAGIPNLMFFHTRDFHTSAMAKAWFSPRLRLVYQQHMQLGVKKKGIFHTRQFEVLDFWVAPTQRLKNQAVEWTRVRSEKLVVVPLAIDTKRFESLPTRNEARRLLAWPTDKTIFGLVGRLDPQKGQHTFVEALHILRRKRDDFIGVIVGDATAGEHEDYVRELKRAECDYIRIYPARPDVETVFAALDVFAMCSVGETYGMVTLEALAAGTAVVGTNSGGTPELLNFGECGKLFPPGDARALAAALNDPIPNRCRKAVIERYRPENMAAAYYELFV